jgi:hypothetical protein
MIFLRNLVMLVLAASGVTLASTVRMVMSMRGLVSLNDAVVLHQLRSPILHLWLAQ